MDIGYAPHHESGIKSMDNAVDQIVYGSGSEISDISYVLPYLYDEQIIHDGAIFSQLAFMSPQPLDPTMVCSLFLSPF